MTQTIAGTVQDLVEQRLPAHSLPQAFYLAPDIYERDVEDMLLRHWICVGHESMVPRPRDYFLFEIDRESVIVVRGEDGRIRALDNVCSHRGSRICHEPTGHAAAGLLTCPYHAWSYRTDGSLRSARMMPGEFDLSAHPLRSITCRVVDGLILVTFAAEPLGLEQVEQTVNNSLRVHGWARAKVIHEETYELGANWKLAIENQLECYHCAPAHPDYTRLHSQAKPGHVEATREMEARARGFGIEIPVRDQWALNAAAGQEADYCARYAMSGDAVTASELGRPVALPMGDFPGYDGGVTFVYVGPVSFFLAYTDYGAIFRFTPHGPDRTRLHVTWLVDRDAVEGVDYTVDRVTWVWRVTSQSDQQIIELNQHGVASRGYRPGPYCLPIESTTNRFVEWYLHELTAAAPAR